MQQQSFLKTPQMIDLSDFFITNDKQDCWSSTSERNDILFLSSFFYISSRESFKPPHSKTWGDDLEKCTHTYVLLTFASKKNWPLVYLIRLTSLRHRKRHIPHQDFSTTRAQWLKIYQKLHSTLRA